MIFRVGDGEPRSLSQRRFADLEMVEADIEALVVERPKILGEDLLVVASQYSKFDKTDERPDVLALDRNGKLVVVELKRDTADETTDLQAIKYASYLSTVTAEQIQEDYRQFWNGRREDDELTPEDVGDEFAEFLGDDEPLPTTESGYADFSLDDKPRILLAAGSFGPEITTPVIWLQREYGLDVTCVELQAYQTGEETLINPRQVLPIPEAEEYMAKRRQKDDEQSSQSRAKPAINVLLEEGVVAEGDRVIFNEAEVPAEADPEFDSDDEFWQAEVTGEIGHTALRWEKTGEKHSCTGLTAEILERATGEPHDVNGYPRWCHPNYEMKTLAQLRREKVGDLSR